MAAMRAEYWARIQSSLKRLATCKVTLEKSSETSAASGLIQVLNCCSGISWTSWSRHACHKLSPAPRAAEAARLLVCPSLISAVASVDIVVLGKQRILVCPHVVHKDVLAMLFSRNGIFRALTGQAEHVMPTAFAWLSRCFSRIIMGSLE